MTWRLARVWIVFLILLLMAVLFVTFDPNDKLNADCNDHPPVMHETTQ